MTINKTKKEDSGTVDSGGSTGWQGMVLEGGRKRRSLPRPASIRNGSGERGAWTNSNGTKVSPRGEHEEESRKGYGSLFRLTTREREYPRGF